MDNLPLFSLGVEISIAIKIAKLILEDKFYKN